MQAVTTVNAKVASKMRSPEGRGPQPEGEGSMRSRKSDRCGSFTSAGWKRQRTVTAGHAEQLGEALLVPRRNHPNLG